MLSAARFVRSDDESMQHARPAIACTLASALTVSKRSGWICDAYAVSGTSSKFTNRMVIDHTNHLIGADESALVQRLDAGCRADL